MGKKPKYDLKEAKIYKTMKDAHNMASEVRLLTLFPSGNQKIRIPFTESSFMLSRHPTSPLLSAVSFSDVVSPFVPTGEVQGGSEEAPQARHRHV